MNNLFDLKAGDEVIYYDGGKERPGIVARVTPSQIEAYSVTADGKRWSDNVMFWKKNGMQVGSYCPDSITVSTPEEKQRVLESLEEDELRKTLISINWYGVKLPALRIINAASKGDK